MFPKNTKAAYGSVTITRPNNTTAYTAGDAIGDTNGSAIFELASFANPAAQVMITDINLEIDVAAIPSGMGTFTVHLYNASPTAIADNAAWSLVANDRSKHLTSVQLFSPTDLVDTLKSSNSGLAKTIKLSTSSLFVILVTDSGFTPSASVIKKLTISGFEV